MISIAMATYNGSKYLSEQIDSILSQTYSDFELVVTDDCSTDDTFSILSYYASMDSRIRIYENESNLGFRDNFAKAIGLCVGDYVALSDQDDIWLPNHLELLISNISTYSIVCANSELIDQYGKSIGMTLKYQESLDYIPESQIRKAKSIFFFRNPYQGASMLLTRDFLKKAMPIPKNVAYHDVWFSSLACFCNGLYYVDSIINLYRMHSNNVSGSRMERKSKLCYWYNLGRHGLYAHRHDLMVELLNRVEEVKGRKQIEKFLRHFTNVHSKRKRFFNWIYITINFRDVFSVNIY